MNDPQGVHIRQRPQQLLHDTRDHLLRLELELLQNLDNRSPFAVLHHHIVFFLVVVQLVKSYYRGMIKLRKKSHLGEELVLLGVFHETSFEDFHCPNLSCFLADRTEDLPIAAFPDDLLKLIVILRLLLLHRDKRLRIDRYNFEFLGRILPLRIPYLFLTILNVFRLYFPNKLSLLTRSCPSFLRFTRHARFLTHR